MSPGPETERSALARAPLAILETLLAFRTFVTCTALVALTVFMAVFLAGATAEDKDGEWHKAGWSHSGLSQNGYGQERVSVDVRAQCVTGGTWQSVKEWRPLTLRPVQGWQQ